MYSQYIPFICTCGCGNAPNSCGCKKIKTSDVVYHGPALDCLSTVCDMPLNDLLVQMATMMCNSASTTSTTSSTSTSTTTTTTTIANCRDIYMNVVKGSGPEALTVTVVDSTLGETVVQSSYLTVGQYSIKFVGPSLPVFDTSTVILSNGNTTPVYIGVVGNNEIVVNSFLTNGTTLDDAVLENQMSIYIKHCTVLPVNTAAYTFKLGPGRVSAVAACADIFFFTTVYGSLPTIFGLTTLYTDPALTIPYNGGGQFFHIQGFDYTVQINSLGVISNLAICP